MGDRPRGFWPSQGVFHRVVSLYPGIKDVDQCNLDSIKVFFGEKSVAEKLCEEGPKTPISTNYYYKGCYCYDLNDNEGQTWGWDSSKASDYDFGLESEQLNTETLMVDLVLTEML